MSGSVTIIGAGIAGLAAGCYARMNGIQARIYELHSQPGGLCAAWRRQGFMVDGCIHWLCGSGPGVSLYHVWEELGAMKDLRYINHRAGIHLEFPDMQFTLYNNADEMEAYLLAMAPEDHDLICEITDAVRHFQTYSDPGSPSSRTPEARAYMNKWMSVTLDQLVGRIQNPKLKRALSTLWSGPVPAFYALLSSGYSHVESAGFPEGGSLAFARAIERRFLELGGEIHYNARVKRILVEEDRAVGLELADGTQVWERDGDIISTADARLTIFDLLEERYTNDRIKEWFAQVPVVPSPVLVTLGVGLPLADAPTSTGGLLFPPETPVTMYGQNVDLINAHVFNFDPTAAPEGKSVVQVGLWGNYPFWQPLRDDRTAYEAEKERIAQQVITALDCRFPGLKEHVEMIDVATPLTFERYTQNWQGSSQGWMPTAQSAAWTQESAQTGSWPASKTLPGLSHFYMAGQWVENFGGLPTAALSARALIEKLCERDGKAFTATKP